MAPRRKIPRPERLSELPSTGPIMPSAPINVAQQQPRGPVASSKPFKVPRPTGPTTTTIPPQPPSDGRNVPGPIEVIPDESTLAAAEADLNVQKIRAARTGVPLVSPLVTPTAPSRNVSGPLEVLPEPKVDSGGGSGFWGQAFGLLSIGTRASASLVKEASDIFNGGDASFTDLWDQFADPEYGYGKAFPEPFGIKNKAIAYPLHFVMDIALDPTTYLTFGGSAIAKTAVRSGMQVATKEITQAAGKKLITEIGQESVEVLAEKVGRTTAERLVYDIGEATAAKTARDSAAAQLDEAIAIGDDLARESAQNALDAATIAARNADQAVQESITDAAIKLGGRGGKVLEKEAARQLAHETWIQSVGTAGEKAAKQALDKATEDLAVSAIYRGGARRAYGRQASLDLAESARLVRDDALNIVGDATQSAARRASAQAVADELTDEVIADIARRGYSALTKDISRALGTTGRTRFGVGRFSTFVPGVGTTRKLIFRAANAARLGAIASGPGREIAELLTPRGRKGLLTPDQIVKIKSSLRTGVDDVGRKLAPEQAVDYLSLLRANDDYLRFRRAAGAANVTAARNAVRGSTRGDRAAVYRALETGVTAGLTPRQQELFTRMADLFSNLRVGTLYEVAGTAGGVLARLGRTLPILKTDRAERWLQLNPTLARQLAEGLRIDEASLTADVLADSIIPGAELFGYVLKQSDIDQGVARLNQIARQYGKLNFDLFETDLALVASKFADRVSDINAYQQAVRVLTQEGRVAREAGRTVVEVSSSDAAREVEDALSELQAVLDETFAPNIGGRPFVESWTPFELERINRDLDILSRSLTSPTGVRGTLELEPFGPLAPKVIPAQKLDEVLELIEGVRARAVAINNAINSGSDYRIGALFKIESKDALKKTIDEAKAGIDKNINVVLNRFNDPAYAGQTWTKLIRDFDNGFSSLANGPWREFPDVGVRQAVQEIFDNVNQIKKPGVLRNFGSFVNTYNQFFKSWMTASPGFHIRNAIGNAWTLFTAGADPRNGTRALNWMNQYLVQNRRALRRGDFITPQQFVDGLKVSQAEKDNILQSLLIIDDIQGQVADAISGGRVGIFGTPATGQLPGAQLPGVGAALRPIQTAADVTGLTTAARAVSTIAGAPLQASRTFGTWVENNARVALMYDGLSKGLTPQEALTRVNKYLFDYQDLSAADQVLRQIIPFWLWGSRNFPLVIENMFTNPRAYKTYLAFDRNFMEDENNLPEIFGPGGIYYPQQLREAGTGVIREGLPGAGRILPLDLGFPGAGRPSIFTEAVEFAVPGGPGNARELLRTFASQSPYAALIEYATGTDLYFDARVDEPAAQLAGNLFAPGTRIGQIAEMFGAETQDPLLQQLFGLREQAEPQRAIETFTGAPAIIGREPRESEVRREILRQYYEQLRRNREASAED